ncbi:hypothetical protein ACOBQJ_13720 [Pelotomaculum propionicicum]|uniref:hypothetical protein n=1 Tax=Pelotomaculum propionicicum TaxID=258475 RepID=UPI003B7A098D
MSILRAIWFRIYNDYFLPSKVADYEEILVSAKNACYTFETFSSFDELINTGTVYDAKRMIIRRDVDTKAVCVMKKLIDAEIKHSARSTCFFRNKTIMRTLIPQIVAGGGMASYHYEELATYAEAKRLRQKEAVSNALPEIRALFERNIMRFRSMTGMPCTVVAAHGDFINVKLGVSNTVILEDIELRNRLGIQREAYDAAQMQYVTCRIADHATDKFKEETLQAIERNEPVIYLLTHPRQWGAAPWANTKENVSRLIRGIKYR